MSLVTTSLFHPLSLGRFRGNRNQGQPDAVANNTNQIDLGQLEAGTAAQNGAEGGNPTRKATTATSDSLFGPNIGLISPGPAWTLSGHPRKTLISSDDLTPEIVKSWIEKSKQPAYPTTTLQALVNLKRPSIRLSPLSSSSSDGEDRVEHGFEFSYDADSPKCGIYISVLLPSSHPDAPPEASVETGLAKLVVFEMVREGGFGRVLRVEDGAVLDLERFESPTGGKENTQDAENKPESSAAGPAEAASQAPSQGGTGHHRRRFTNFHFRKRSAAGPALAVMDAENSPPNASGANGTGTGQKEKEDDDNGGVKITIRLAALDEHDRELESVNEQITYLQVVRFGAPPSDEDKDKEDKRPWVVKVVKREATIGPHTFHLHEIYGLSSSSTSTPAKVEGSDEKQDHVHTYPPTLTSAATTSDDDSPSSECLLCLSSPREVVLLPCRHLVACKECALNMVEFGAGGTVVQPLEPTPDAQPEPTGDGAPTTNAEGSAAPAADANTPAQPATQPRRKRKAKGWFCPVCRQPYTSLLRITTSPPSEIHSAEEVIASNETTAPSESPSSGGGIMGMLRGFSSQNVGSATNSGNNTSNNTPTPLVAADASDRV